MRYRVVCDNEVPVDQPKTHAHIVEVGPVNRAGFIGGSNL
jgi:hypothetical protein